MDTVKAFNAELSSLYDMKPPISKAKMTAITKGAIKAVKFYKHVVQSVEKFLQKCRPEYKIPGLYVIDSIVRQSRHQFGADKDVFAPRFSKNVTYTFYFIYQCTVEEKSKVIRVLNLWQKNAVFPPEVIQPLFDMADASHPKYKEVAQFVNSKGASSSGISTGKSNSQEGSTMLNGNKEAAVSFEETSNDGNQSQSLVMGNLPSLSSTEMSLATRLQHLQHLFGQEPPNNASNPLAAQPPTSAKGPTGNNDTGQIRFNKKLLDFDYDEEDEEPDKAVRESSQHQPKQQPPPPPQQQQPAQTAPAPVSTSNSAETLGTLLTNPDILRHLQSLQQQIAQPVVQPTPVNTNHHHVHHHQQQQQHEEHSSWESANNHGQYGQIDFTQPPPGFMPMGAGGMGHQPVGFPHHHPPQPPNAPSVQFPQHHHPPTIREDLFQPGNGEIIEIDPPRSKERERRRSRSGSRSRRARSGGRHGGRRSSRSRSRSRDRGGVRRRSRSRSRNRNSRTRPRSRSRDQEREKERLEREKERDRKRRGLPPIKKESLSVCSTTLWVGHLSKLVQQEELSDTFGQYGEIVSIDLIPPRGCAFVCMHRRQDAFRALTKLAGHKLQGKAITLAWAPGKGVKAKEWKDFWEVDQGVSYVPWQRLSQMTDLEALEEGGSFDEETLPPWLRHHLNPEDKIGQQMIPMAPAGFIPIPEAGPPTPEMSEPGGGGQIMSTASGPSSLNAATTTLPANLPTYAAVAPHSLGLLPVPLGMPPGLRLPPPGTAAAHLLMSQAAGAGTNAAMATHLLGQSILAGLGAAAAAQGLGPGMGQPAGPSGFFSVFNPHLPGHPHQQPQQPPQMPSQDDADDMELEEADDDVQQQQHHKEMDGRNRSAGGWNDQFGEDRPDMMQHRQQLQHRTPDKSNNGPRLLERLRSLANHDAGPIDHHHHLHNNNNNGPELTERDVGPLHLRTDMAGPGSSADQYGLSPNLASSLRGVPLTAAAAEMGIRLLRGGGGGPPDTFGTPGRGGAIGNDDPFMPRQPHLGGTSFGPDNFGSMRGRHFGHDSRGGRGGGGFRGDVVEPAWDEEHLPPPRWRQQEDWPDREPPPPSRHWDRDRDRDRDHSGGRGGRGGGGDWSSPRRPPPPPLPPRGHDRGQSSRDRYGGGNGGRGGGDRGSDRRRSGDRDRDPLPPRDRERRTSERRSSGRWSDRKSPDPAAAATSSNNNQTTPAPLPVPAPTGEGSKKVPIPCDVREPSTEDGTSATLESSVTPAVGDAPATTTSKSHSPPPPASSPRPPPPTLPHPDADLTAPGTEEEEPPSTD